LQAIGRPAARDLRTVGGKSIHPAGRSQDQPARIGRRGAYDGLGRFLAARTRLPHADHAADILQIDRAETMFEVTREIDFCYGHRLLRYAESLDRRGMLLDFSDIKRVIAGWIDENLDHRMILCREDPVVPMLQEMKEPLFLIDDNPTAENIAKIIYDFSAGHPEKFPVTKVRLWETPHCYATYRA